MLQPIILQLQELMRVAREVYSVDPVVFLVLYLGCAPLWYFSLFRTLRALASRRMQQVALWSTVFMVATVLPFLYVMLFGRNLPWWVYVLLVALIAQAGYGLASKMRSNRHSGQAG